MDTLTFLGSALPSLGAYGVFVVIIGVLFRAWVKALGRADSIRAEMAEAHRKELAELDEKVDRLERKIDTLQSDLDNERKLRRAAEDDAAAVRRRGGEPS